MPRSARPRRAYRPRPVSTDPVEDTIARVGLLPPGQAQQFILPLRAAWADLRRGAPPAYGDAARSRVLALRRAWSTVADALNVSEALAREGVASDRIAEFAAAQAAMAALHGRAAAAQRWTLSGPEISAIDLALELHEIQLGLCTQGELANAIEAVRRRVRGALSGSPPRDAIVCVGLLQPAQPCAAT